MISTTTRIRIQNILSRLESNQKVTLEERIWMNKLCEHNAQAKSIAEQLLCPNTVGEDVAYYQ